MVAIVAYHLPTLLYIHIFFVVIIFIRGGGGCGGGGGSGVLIHASTSTFLLPFLFFFSLFFAASAPHFYYYYFQSRQKIYMTHSSVREGSASLLLFFLKYNTNFVYVHNFYLIYALSASAFQTTFTLLYKNKCFAPSRRKYRSDENEFCLFRLFARASRRLLFPIQGHQVVGFVVFHATMRHIDHLKCTQCVTYPRMLQKTSKVFLLENNACGATQLFIVFLCITPYSHVDISCVNTVHSFLLIFVCCP